MPLYAVVGRTAAAWLALVLMLFANSANAAGLASDWVGAYGYSDGRGAVYFSLSLANKGNRLTGFIEETQTFGSRSGDGKLRANVSGSVNGHVVTFTKTYDGSGGQSHSVTYRGTLVREGEFSFMFGTWHLGNDVGSWFATVPEE